MTTAKNVSYYNTAIKQLSKLQHASSVEAALQAIALEQYGSSDAWVGDDYWLVVVDGREYTLEEAAAI